MRTIKILITFYQSFAALSILTTLACSIIIYKWGIATFFVLFWFKIATLGLIYYFINIYKKESFFYYKNLGLTKRQVWIPTLTFDMALFLLIISFILKIN